MKRGSADPAADSIIQPARQVFGDFLVNGVAGAPAVIVPNGTIKLYANAGPQFQPTGKSKYLIDFFLEINPDDLFYRGTPNYNNGWINPNQTVVSLKRMFQITLRDGTVLETEKPLSIVIKGTYE